ncbi:olfactory receptor 8K3-like [Elephas maximus indicus]|uniref:olfactory receptor 8K3-like n=1 Tax=Elephas maximus indicus TaxID=99487 RepID=UPI0021162567|nr:olfactory receptor 8K3-like [Elephas maximus indicus]
MDEHNLTDLNEFILMGITDRPELQAPLFGLFLIIYMIAVMGNLGIIILTKIDSKLQTPMYFFLRNLAITDLLYSTTVGPKMLQFILSAMSYDRYVAICKPLLYTVIMSQSVCWGLVTITYLYSTFVSLLITIKIFNSSFCGYNVINHFYCDAIPFLSLLCSNTHDIELILLVVASIDTISSLLIVLVSYLFLLIAILRMNSAEGRYKAFSTCGSHLTVLVLFYGPSMFIYMQPTASHSIDTAKLASIFYTLVIPKLNPLIYSLRNRDVKYALLRICNKISNICSKF